MEMAPHPPYRPQRQNRDELAEFYKRVFGLEEKYRGATVLSTFLMAVWGWH